jgi:hypothetical protein
LSVKNIFKRDPEHRFLSSRIAQTINSASSLHPVSGPAEKATRSLLAEITLFPHFTAVSLFSLASPPLFQTETEVTKAIKLIFLESFPESFPVVPVFPFSTSLHYGSAEGRKGTWFGAMRAFEVIRNDSIDL